MNDWARLKINLRFGGRTNEDAAMIGKFPDCLARFTDMCIASRVAADEK